VHFVQTEQPQEPFAWVASANLRQVRQRLGELRQVRAVLHQEERLLHARRQELDPTSGRPLKCALPAAIMTCSHVLCARLSLWKTTQVSSACGSHMPLSAHTVLCAGALCMHMMLILLTTLYMTCSHVLCAGLSLSLCRSQHAHDVDPVNFNVHDMLTCPLCWPQPSLVHAHDVGLVNYLECHFGVISLNYSITCIHASADVGSRLKKAVLLI